MYSYSFNYFGWGRESLFFLLLITCIFVVSVPRHSSSSRCLERLLFYRGTPWPIHTTLFFQGKLLSQNFVGTIYLLELSLAYLK